MNMIACCKISTLYLKSNVVFTPEKKNVKKNSIWVVYKYNNINYIMIIM